MAPIQVLISDTCLLGLPEIVAVALQALFDKICKREKVPYAVVGTWGCSCGSPFGDLKDKGP